MFSKFVFCLFLLNIWYDAECEFWVLVVPDVEKSFIAALLCERTETGIERTDRIMNKTVRAEKREKILSGRGGRTIDNLIESKSLLVYKV